MFMRRDNKGFTLIELLIVIAIIAIIVSVVFVALDPLKRFADSRDSSRWQDVAALSNAIQVYQVDNGGAYLNDIASTTEDQVYMIVSGDMDSGCDDNNSDCDENVIGGAHCVDLSGLVTTGTLSAVPVSDSIEVDWDDGDGGGEGTGYTLERNSNGTVTIRACESENSSEIEITR